MTKTVHALTPSSKETVRSLAAAEIAAPGDLIADLGNFPPLVYEVVADGDFLDITTRLLTVRDYWAAARKWFSDFTANTGLQDALAIEEYGFWWTLNYTKFVPALSDLGNLFPWLDLLDAIRRKDAPDSIVIHGRHEVLEYLTGQIYRGVPIQVQGEPTARRRAGTPAAAVRKAGLVAVRVLLGLVYLCLSLLWRPAICFFTNTNLLRVTEVKGRQTLRDIYLGDVIGAFRERGWRVGVIEKCGPNASWRGLAARRFFFPNDLFFTLSAAPLRKLGLYRRTAQDWEKRWQQIRPKLPSHCQYLGYDIRPVVEPLIKHEFSHNGPGLEIMTRLWSRTLKLWRPKVLYINCYYSRSAVPAIIAAKALGIATIEQQHGIIANNHLAYLVPRDLGNSSRFPLCDHMIVWGDYAKRLLVEAGVYRAEQVTVCGFPRIDALLGSLPPREETLAKLSMPPSNPVVLYTSNMIAQGFLAEILDGIHAVSGQLGIQWIVKLHPREKTRSIWEQESARRGLDTVRVVEGELDFYSLLAACDIHASFASTTVIEAAILGRLNLGLNVPRVPDPVGYEKAGAFVPVAPGQLGPVALQILRDPTRQASLQRQQERFAKDWCVHDGQAVGRIVATVASVIATSS